MRRVIAGATVALALAGCRGSDPGSGAGPTPGGTAAGLASAVCPHVERPPLQTGSHLIGDSAPPVPYSSAPASSGWHATSVPRAGIHDIALTDPEIVSLLETGVVVVAHRPDAAPDPDLARALVAQFPDLLAITPYTGDMPTAVALVTWGTVARCAAVDAAAVTEFVVTQRVTPGEVHAGS